MGKSCVWLRVAGYLAGVMGALLFFVLAPLGAVSCARAFPAYALFFWPGLIFVWALALMYALALYHYFRIVALIAKDESFSFESAKHLRSVSLCAWCACLWLGAGLVAVCLSNICPPWLWLIFFGFIAFSAVCAMLSRALAALTARAAQIKSENDLTV